MDIKSLNKYWKEHKLDKQNILALQFWLKTISLVSLDIANAKSGWKKANKKELNSLKCLYEKINMSIQVKQLDENTCNNENYKALNSLLTFFSFMLQATEGKLDSEETAKDSNLPALKWTRSLLKNGEACVTIDKELDKIANAAETNVQRKRKPQRTTEKAAYSQDTDMLFRGFRKKRSNQIFANADINLDNDSPKMNSMGVIDFRRKLDTCPSQDANTLKNKIENIAPSFSFNTHK